MNTHRTKLLDVGNAIRELAVLAPPQYDGPKDKLWKQVEAERNRARSTHDQFGKIINQWAARRLRAALARKPGVRVTVDAHGRGWIPRYADGEPVANLAQVHLTIYLPHGKEDRLSMEATCSTPSIEELTAWVDKLAAQIRAGFGKTEK